jgi:hypothetical protein
MTTALPILHHDFTSFYRHRQSRANEIPEKILKKPSESSTA